MLSIVCDACHHQEPAGAFTGLPATFYTDGLRMPTTVLCPLGGQPRFEAKHGTQLYSLQCDHGCYTQGKISASWMDALPLTLTGPALSCAVCHQGWMTTYLQGDATNQRCAAPGDLPRNGNWYQYRCNSCTYAGEPAIRTPPLLATKLPDSKCTACANVSTLKATLRGGGVKYPIYDITCTYCGAPAEHNIYDTRNMSIGLDTCPYCKAHSLQWCHVPPFAAHCSGPNFAIQLQMYRASHPLPAAKPEVKAEVKVEATSPTKVEVKVEAPALPAKKQIAMLRCRYRGRGACDWSRRAHGAELPMIAVFDETGKWTAHPICPNCESPDPDVLMEDDPEAHTVATPSSELVAMFSIALADHIDACYRAGRTVTLDTAAIYSTLSGVAPVSFELVRQGGSAVIDAIIDGAASLLHARSHITVTKSQTHVLMIVPCEVVTAPWDGIMQKSLSPPAAHP